MGAFVGQKTSVFMRRRKGRMGADKWVEKIAPTFAGAFIRSAAGNHLCMVCAPNASGTYQVNDTQGDSPWFSVALPVDPINPVFIGNGSANGNALVARPFFENLDFELWHLQGHFAWCGPQTGIGGCGGIIQPNGKLNQQTFQVSGRPQESIAYSSDGESFFSTGQKGTGAQWHCRGGNIFAPEAVLIGNDGTGTSAAGASGLDITIPTSFARLGIQNFLATSGDTDENLIIARRLSAGNWSAIEKANPFTNGYYTSWLQRNNLIIGINELGNSGIRSLDGGNTWSTMTHGVNGVDRAIWRQGSRIFIAHRDAPRIQVSLNNGNTWQTFSPALPSGTAEPNRIALHWDTVYLLCNDGAVNRLYAFKMRGEI